MLHCPSIELLNKQIEYVHAMQQMGISGDQLTMGPSHQDLSLPFQLPVHHLEDVLHLTQVGSSVDLKSQV